MKVGMVKNITVSYGIQEMIKKKKKNLLWHICLNLRLKIIFLETKSVLRHLRLIPFKHSFPEKSLIEKNFL